MRTSVLLRVVALWVACLFVMLDGQWVFVDGGRGDEEVKVLFHICTSALLWAVIVLVSRGGIGVDREFICPSECIDTNRSSPA